MYSWWRCVVVWFCLVFLGSACLKSQSDAFEFGFRSQKAIGLYYENGITFQCPVSVILSKKSKDIFSKVLVGGSYVTSRIGSAVKSNALKQDNYVFSVSYVFRHTSIVQPFISINAGFFYSDYEFSIFNDLQNKSGLLSIEPGLGIDTKWPLKILISSGYNFITGDGKTRPGVLFPIYIQTSILWQFLKK